MLAYRSIRGKSRLTSAPLKRNQPEKGEYDSRPGPFQQLKRTIGNDTCALCAALIRS
jgi:hypothetical protein